MRQVNIHDARTHLSRLVAEAAEGRPFVIARAGRPMVEVRAVRPPAGAAACIGFLRHEGPPPAPVEDVGGDALRSLMEGGDGDPAG